MTLSRRAALVALLVLAACDDGPPVPSIPGGDVDRGRLLVDGYGCGTCHSIPDLPGADALVGPPLDGFARQAYIAGRLPNQPRNLMDWLMDPPAIKPMTAMPDLGVTADDARDMASYIYTLKNGRP